MFYIAHGTTKEVDNNTQQFDARTYQWKNIPKDSLHFQQYSLQEKELASEWLHNGCHPNGLFFCNRCYRKHYIPDNFDLLCDGFSDILKQYHSDGVLFEFTDRFNDWGTNPSIVKINAAIALRSELNDVFTSDSLFYEDKSIIVIRDPLKNNGDLEVCLSTSDINDKKSRFTINVKDILISS